MTRWEHRVVFWTPPLRRPAVPEDKAITDVLNRFGANGWLIAEFMPPAYGRRNWIFVFTRPAEETS